LASSGSQPAALKRSPLEPVFQLRLFCVDFLRIGFYCYPFILSPGFVSVRRSWYQAFIPHPPGSAPVFCGVSSWTRPFEAGSPGETRDIVLFDTRRVFWPHNPPGVYDQRSATNFLAWFFHCPSTVFLPPRFSPFIFGCRNVTKIPSSICDFHFLNLFRLGGAFIMGFLGGNGCSANQLFRLVRRFQSEAHAEVSTR